MRTLISVDRYNNDSFEVLKIAFPDEIEELEKAFNNCLSENDPKILKILKAEIPDEWRYFCKNLAYVFGCFNSIIDYQKPVNNLEKGLLH